MGNESNKQNSVEYLFKQLWEEPKDKLNWYAILEQAKALHKEEIIKFAADHCYPTYELAKIDAEDYYNKTFKSE